MCGSKTLERQTEVPANQTHCITDYGHYLYVNIPFDNSDVTITTSGGTFSGTDADIKLYEGDWWSGTVEASSITAGTNEESLSFVSRAGDRYFKIDGNIQETSLIVTVTGGDIPPPMGDYIVYPTSISVSVPDASITSKAQYGSTIATILAASYSDFADIAGAANDPITDVTRAIHFLAKADDLTDPDLNQLLYFLGSYKYYAEQMTASEASALSTALLAVTQMTDFISPAGTVIQEGYAKALNNFERYEGAIYYKDHLPHLLATLQYFSLQSNPFGISNAGDSTMAILLALGSASYYGDSETKAAFNDNMLDVLSVLRSFAFLGETSLDTRWSAESDIKWILPHSFNAMGKISSIATEEAQGRFDSTVLEVRGKVINTISVETTETIITKNYLESAGRACEEGDALFGSCVIPPKEEDILTVSHDCSANITIRAQSSISQATLDQSCADMALQATEFHAFFNTAGNPVSGDKNTHIEVVAFASPEDYEKYAGEFFGISTDNGGMYLEGTPENDGNQARFIAMQCPDSWVGGSCQYEDQIYNLRHEYVHYLDGRFIKAGSYGDFDYNVSWSEGMAEYMAMGTEHTRTFNTLKGETIPPLYNLLFMSYEYDNLYPWGYFAMRYLGEEHKGEINTLVSALRAGDNNAYVEALKGVAQRTEDGFEAYMLANSETVAPAAAAMPEQNTIGSCDLEQQYVRRIDANKTDFTFTNTTDTPVSLFWVNSTTGETNFGNKYDTLNQGDTYTSSSWSVGDRMMLSDNNMNCLGVAVMAENSNTFTIEADLVKDVVAEEIPALNQLGSCALAQPHLIMDESHEFTITNTSDTAVRLFRIDNTKGTIITTSGANEFTHGYGVLKPGASYTNDVWYGDRRLMVTDSNLNCLSVGVLNNPVANFTVDQAIVASAAEPEMIPAANTIGSCDLMAKHLTGPFEADFSFVNNSDNPVRIHRIDAETGELSESFGFTTLAKGETYDSTSTWKWFGNRRAAITDENNQCLGVAVMTEEDTSNDYIITNDIGGGTQEPVDSDGDGVIDSEDAFPNDPTETKDSDGDGTGDNSDAFPNDASETTDSDGDGVGNNGDAFPNDPSETKDTDGDGTGDNSDAFPTDASETTDSDGDGTGDNSDAFPNDASETTDSDGDGTGDNSDAFPNDSTETKDSDGDGTGDNSDAFPNDPTETKDSDGDGIGDNADPTPFGEVDSDGDGYVDSIDAFPNDPTEWADTDSDGTGDNSDAFPTDATETKDSDADGVGDNADAFPNDATETTDSDGDGVGDNADAFPNDASETTDSDGDGYGDNSDVFPNDSTEWADSDNDGMGDNSDPYPNDPNNGGGVTVPDCGAATITGGKLTLDNNECVAGGRGSYYVWVEEDNTKLYISTAGGNGDVGIYFNADTWATTSNAQAASSANGTTHVLEVTTNRGWRYITLNTNSNYDNVTLAVSLTNPDVTEPVDPIDPVDPPVTDITNACVTLAPNDYTAIESGNALCTDNGRNSYYIYLDDSVTSIDINTAHGTGEAELYVGNTWANASTHTHKSTTAGTTLQSITVNNPPIGWFYIGVENTGNDVAVQVDVK
ncbi:collagenase [Litorilituus lipolyticus]|uniref:Collagenase n=2 Tax=Litorilituus lipolyticus TaxID=2491017 RepID=A0A502L3T4_9GAMM|nr:collagenase [Litorilituus lipolyticus]